MGTRERAFLPRGGRIRMIVTRGGSRYDPPRGGSERLGGVPPLPHWQFKSGLSRPGYLNIPPNIPPRAATAALSPPPPRGGGGGQGKRGEARLEKQKAAFFL